MMIVERPIPKSKWPVHLIGRGVVQHHHHQGKSLFSLSPSHSSSPLEGVGDVKNDNGNERSSQTRVKLFMSSAHCIIAWSGSSHKLHKCVVWLCAED